MNLDELWVAQYPALIRNLRKYTKNAAQAEDLAQTAFLRALERADTLETMSEAHLQAWLLRTAYNAFIDDARKQKRREDLPLQAPVYYDDPAQTIPRQFDRKRRNRMKTYLKNVAVLNMLKATPENVGQIYKIGNAAIAFVSPLTKPLLAKMDVKNIASVVEVPENTRLLKANGEYTLSGIGADSPFFLTVNGKLTVDERMTAEEIRASVAGGMINGIVYATASQMLALSGAGISVNGSCVTYPDGTGLRRDQSPLTAAEAGALTHSLFLPACVRIEEGVCSQGKGACAIRQQGRDHRCVAGRGFL